MASKAYTVSKMLQSINEVMAPLASSPHATVSLKRKMDNGVLLDTSPKQIALLDLQAKVKHAADQVAAIDASGGDKHQWMTDKRQSGNDAFRWGQFQQAAELYVEALAGLDFGDSPEQRRACEVQEQVPLTCNLASCLLMMEQWEKARQVCSTALQVDAACVRALSQRAKALSRLARFDEARCDLQLAIDAFEAGGETGGGLSLDKLNQQLAAVDRAERRERASIQQQRIFQKQMMREAVGRLYEDKETVIAPKPADGASREPAPMVAQMPLRARIVQWLASMLLVVLRFLFGSLEKRE